MEIRFKEDFSMFSREAKDTLHKHVKDYTLSLKEESERVAASRYDPDGDVQVTKGIVEHMIGVHGHHVVRKPSLFFTYILPLLEAIAGGSTSRVSFKYRNRSSSFNPTDRIMLHKGLWKALNVNY
jgi:hypothetical protein